MKNRDSIGVSQVYPYRFLTRVKCLEVQGVSFVDYRWDVPGDVASTYGVFYFYNFSTQVSEI